MATELLSWSKPFHTVQHGGLEHGDIAWFLDGQLNASYNCVDRHAFADPDKVNSLSSAQFRNRSSMRASPLPSLPLTRLGEAKSAIYANLRA